MANCEPSKPSQETLVSQPNSRPLPPAWRRALGTIVPWLVAAGLIAYVFSRVPIGEAWSVAQEARLDLFIPLVFGGVAAWFLIESLVYAFLFTRFNAPVSFREARSLRGMSYLLTPIHWNVGKAAVILRLRQTKEIPVLEATSSVMLYQGIDGAILATFATLGLSLLISENPVSVGLELSGVRATTALIVLLIIFNISFTRATWPRNRLFDWWRGLTIHRSHRLINLRDVAVIVAGKGTYHFLQVLVFYYGTAAFGIDLPFPLVLAATPIIQAVGGLPITPAGLGTQQAAMLYFFGDAFGGGGSEAAIVAFGFSLPVGLILARCLIGLVYVRDLTATRENQA
jgi:hypothetical protein